MSNIGYQENQHTALLKDNLSCEKRNEEIFEITGYSVLYCDSFLNAS